MDLSDFCVELEAILKDEVKGNFEHDWDENFITRSILKRLRKKFSNIKFVNEDNKPIIVSSMFYEKLTGRNENKFGDIALIFKIQHEEQDEIQGVAFLEAKKFGRGKSKKFDALKVKQLTTICENTQHSMLLLYDHESIKSFEYFRLYHSTNWLRLRETYAVVVPTKLALLTEEKDRKLYTYSSPFSHQFCTRYIRGLDLEFDQEALNTAKGISTERGAPKYVVFFLVKYLPNDNSDDNDIIQSDLNGNIFQELEDE